MITLVSSDELRRRRLLLLLRSRWHERRARERRRKEEEGEVGNATRTFDMNEPTDSRHRYRYRGASDVEIVLRVRASKRNTRRDRGTVLLGRLSSGGCLDILNTRKLALFLSLFSSLSLSRHCFLPEQFFVRSNNICFDRTVGARAFQSSIAWLSVLKIEIYVAMISRRLLHWDEKKWYNWQRVSWTSEFRLSGRQILMVSIPNNGVTSDTTSLILEVFSSTRVSRALPEYLSNYQGFSGTKWVLESLRYFLPGNFSNYQCFSGTKWVFEYLKYYPNISHISLIIR